MAHTPKENTPKTTNTTPKTPLERALFALAMKYLPIFPDDNIPMNKPLEPYCGNVEEVCQWLGALEHIFHIKFDFGKLNIGDITLGKIDTMISKAITTEIYSIFNDDFGVSAKDLDPNQSLQYLGFDSINALDAMTQMEKRFELPLSAISDVLDARCKNTPFVLKDIYPNGFGEMYTIATVGELCAIAKNTIANAQLSPKKQVKKPANNTKRPLSAAELAAWQEKTGRIFG